MYTIKEFNEQVRKAYLDVKSLDANFKTKAKLLSMFMIAAAMGVDVSLYKKISEDMLANLCIKSEYGNGDYETAANYFKDEKTFLAWMLGRLLIAANEVNDIVTVYNVEAFLTVCLEDADTKDHYAVWAWGYWGTVYLHDPISKKITSLVQGFTEPLKDENLVVALWELTMFAQATAFNNDINLFTQVILAMKIVSGKETVSQALAKIPMNDFRAWAIGIVAHSASKMKETHNIAEELLETINQAETDLLEILSNKEIKEETRLNYEADKLLLIAHTQQTALNLIPVTKHHELESHYTLNNKGA